MHVYFKALPTPSFPEGTCDAPTWHSWQDDVIGYILAIF
jgi:hypothetical protein